MSRCIDPLLSDDKPREKILTKGVETLGDGELLAVLLGQGTRGQDVFSLAEKLLPVLDEKGLEVGAQDLMALKGIGSAKAAIILAAMEYTRRLVKPKGVRIHSPKDLYPHIRHYADRKQECLLAVSLNGAHEILNIRLVSMGLVNATQVHPREVFADPLMDRATAVIVAHNHPSGHLSPSSQDLAVTRQLIRAGALLGISLLDHVIFNEEAHLSMKEMGVFKEGE